MDPTFKLSDLENKVKRVEMVLLKVSSKSKPAEPRKSKFGKNFKMDNITFNGNSGDMNWEDMIKIGGQDMDDDFEAPQRPNRERADPPKSEEEL